MQSGPTPTTTPHSRLNLAKSSALKFSHRVLRIGSTPPILPAPTAKSRWKPIRSRTGFTSGTVLLTLRVKATSRSASARTTAWIIHPLRCASTNSTSLLHRFWSMYQLKVASIRPARSCSKARLPTPTRERLEATFNRFGSPSLARTDSLSSSSSRVRPAGPTSGTLPNCLRATTRPRCGLLTATSASEKPLRLTVALQKLAPSPSTTTTSHPTSNSLGSVLRTSPPAALTAIPFVPHPRPKSWVLLETSVDL